MNKLDELKKEIQELKGQVKLLIELIKPVNVLPTYYQCQHEYNNPGTSAGIYCKKCGQSGNTYPNYTIVSQRIS